MSDSHLSSHELAAYLSADIAQDERRRMEMHLADCDECRDELVAVRRLVASPVPPKRRSPVAIGVAAAAVVAVLLIPWRIFREPAAGDAGVEMRRPAAETGRESVNVVLPSAAARLPMGPVTLAWRADSGAIYQVRVTDEDGDVVWSTRTRDTTAVVPDTTFARRGGGIYYLYVDAQQANGHSFSSGARAFEVGR